MNLVIETYEYDKTARTGRWKAYRHRDGSKDVAQFETIGRARRFARKHCLGGVFGKAQIVNRETNETTPL